MVSPFNTRSSPTLTTAVNSCGSTSSLSARSRRAAPTPPERTVITSETLEARRYHRVVSTLDDDWPGSPAYVVLRMNGGSVERVAEHGDLEAVRPWASISKLVLAMAFGVEMDWDLHSYTEMVG